MSRVKILLIILFILALIIIIIALRSVSTSQQEGSTPITSPTPLENIQNQQKQMTLPNSGVKVNRFINGNQQKSQNGDIIVENNPQKYITTYNEKSEQFTVNITGSFTEEKTIAEKNLISTLGVNANDVCKLNIIIITTDPLYKNDRYFLDDCTPHGEGPAGKTQ